MKKNKRKKTARRVNLLRTVCWIIIPVIVTAFLVLDAFGVYTFTAERLIVLGACLLVLLLPFIREITVKGISLKRNDKDEGT